uniref:Uncharacterized protein n=1 Tax=Tanacetum cinerariifolium TaxID=118510 RepID=A0A699V6Y2_TANCI|nr:hypothetical protein [Tanacetum cinerariifolium]
MVFGKQGTHAVQAFRHDVEHGAAVGHGQFLRQLADFQARCTPDAAVIGQLNALDQLEHAGFTGAVTTDDADPLSTGDLPGHLVQQRHGAERKGHIGEFEQGHELLQKPGAHST